MRLEKRVRALEARLIGAPVILHFADGSKRELLGSGDFLLHLFYSACGGADLNPGQVAQLNLICQSVSAKEPGGGRMCEVLQAVFGVYPG
jgi:hypothetical protein